MSATAPRVRALWAFAGGDDRRAVMLLADPLVEGPRRGAALLGPARPNRVSAIVPLVHR